MSSTSKVEVVRVYPIAHPQADLLEICQVFGYTVCVRKGDFKHGDLGAYITPDSICDTNRPEFAFLKKEGRDKERIKVKRLRGILSMGLLIPAPKGCPEGVDCASFLGVTRYEPPEPISTGGESISGPNLVTFKYDVDSIYRYPEILKENELVCISEKIHGANSRYVYHNGQLYVGSRKEWKKEDNTIIWWKALTNEIVDFCQANPDYILYGECYGMVKNFKYYKNHPTFAAFDIYHKGQFLSVVEFLDVCRRYEIPTVPIIALDSSFNFDKIKELSGGNSLITGANHIREGVVVRPMIERTCPEIGRVVLKCVSESYYNK